MKTGKKKGQPQTAVKFTHCTKYPVQGRNRVEIHSQNCTQV